MDLTVSCDLDVSLKMPLRCLNCGLRVQRIQRHVVTTLPQELQIILSVWLRIEHFPLEDVICQACYLLLQNANVNSPRILGHSHVCVGCGCSLTGVRLHYLEENDTFLEYFTWIRSIQNQRNGYEVCHNCWRRASRQSAQDVQRVIAQDDNEAVIPPVLPAPTQDQRPIETDTVYLPHYKRAANTSRHCIYSDCGNAPAHLIPMFIKKKIIMEHNFYVPRSARVCQQHLYTNTWHLLPQEPNTMSSFTVHQIEDLIDITKQEAVTFDFECVEEMPNHICHYWTGLEVFEFVTLINELPLVNRVPSPKKSLAIFLIKMRTGDSNQRLSSLFNMPRSTMERHMNIVRSCFTEYFVPLHIGLQHLTRQDIIRRNLSIPNAFFGNINETNQTRPAITICDGTYIYIEKSSNYFYQKETYSLHKYLNLVKPFLLVCSDGHIIDVVGPYAATQTDADIMKDLFSDETGPMRTFYSAGDVFILDRGFRDAIPLLEACNYNVQKPESLNEGEHQLTTIQANKSRLVTLCRWVVEVVNGRFKRDYKLFRQEFFNRAHSHLMQDFKIAAALINRFHPTIQDRPDAHLIIERAMRYLQTPNYLAQFVSENNLNRRSVMFRRIDGSFPGLDFFPIFSYSDLILFALGPYQVKQARSYYGEHVRQNGLYEIEVCPELEHSEEMVMAVGGNRPYLLRGRIKSRHVGRRKYFTYILIDAQPSSNNCLDAILGYCCNCLVGNRTVGCCCHVMAIIWYFGWARLQNNISAPASFLDNILLVIDE